MEIAVRIQDAPLKMIAGRIRRARRDAELSLDRLGEMVGTSRHHLIRLEKGQHRPRAEMLTRIAEATEKPLDWFVDPEAGDNPFQSEETAA